VVACAYLTERSLISTGSAHRRAISEGISWNICHDTATSAIWNVT
jgi:hypothetical protein